MVRMDDDEFVITVNGRNAARIQFLRAGQNGMKQDVLVITHTVVFESFKGKGYGKQLIYALVDYAREHNKVIEPQCPFAKAFFEKTPEIQDVFTK